MPVSSLLLPVFVQVALTFLLLGWMWRLRVAALSSRKIGYSDIALGEAAWPPRAIQVGNCFHNQLELPVLFYVLVAFILITSTNSAVFVLLAWLFVLARLAHAFVHTGSNSVPRRFSAALASAVILAAMWVIFAIRILATGA